MENGSNNSGPPMRGGFRGRGGMPRGSFDGRGRGRGMGRGGGPMGSMPRGFNGPPALRRGLMRGIMSRGMNFRGGPSRGNPGRGGRPMNYNYQNQSTNIGPPSNDVAQKPEASSNTPNPSSQQTSKPTQNNSHSSANDQSNTAPINQSGPPTSKVIGNSIRGGRGGGMSQRRGGSSYNPNINVTGNDIQQGSNPPSKPFYRGGLSRGRGGFQQGPTRPNGPMHGSNHQPGMMQPGIPLKRGPPIGLPGPKRGRYEQTPSHRLQKYPMQGPQGPTPPQLQGPPNHQQPQSQPNYSNNYPNSIPPMQHQPNNYYGPQGNGGYDQMGQIHDYSQNYVPPPSQSAYSTNGYSQYPQQSYPQTSEYDQSQGYSQDYNTTSYQQDARYPTGYTQSDYNTTNYGTSTDYNTSTSDYSQAGTYDNRSYSGYDTNYTGYTAKSDAYQSHAGYY
ncbi:basic salivary proline-rich protein 2-like isoform X1 [Contarinia nasturtii]|uniref:basic salivary proline-rich protein 2-like isoform X1 n=1 Tax=Contarinia nasturtii TaxID=265458 RepID=UPI0012D4022D|nr:basic salivary proline-rich protein 2-like isoform X1 [Contarinia nasturtii]